MKLKESLIQNHTHPSSSQPWSGRNSIEEGHWWAWFRTMLSLSFNFSHIRNIRAGKA